MDMTEVSWGSDIFSRQDALAAGYTVDQIRHRVRTGKWIRVRKGLYAIADAEELPTLEQLKRTVRAAQRRIPDSVASHHTAAALLQLALYGPTGPVTLTRDAAPNATPVDLPGVRILRSALPAGDIIEIDGVRTTSIARTVCDRARTSSFRAGVVTADHALHAGLPREALKDVLAHCKRWPGKQRAAAVAELAEPLTESALESISRVLFKDSALPMPRPQATVRDSYGGFVARVDFLWEELGVVGEADGDVKYTSPFGVEAESAQRLGPLLLEKRRQEAIENQGLEVVRWSYADILSRPVQTDARIRAAFRRAERLRGPAA